jgi:hypothetical protein
MFLSDLYGTICIQLLLQEIQLNLLGWNIYHNMMKTVLYRPHLVG